MDGDIPIHATAVAVDNSGILLCGASGSGKSDLALRLIDRGAKLISDDRVIIRKASDLPRLYAPPNIAGKIEIRALGITAIPFEEGVTLRLAVMLDQIPERLPDGWKISVFGGFSIPMLAINGFEASAPIKVEHALKSLLAQNIMPVAAQPSLLYSG